MRFCDTENWRKRGIANCIIINLQFLPASQHRLKHLKNLFHAMKTSYKGNSLMWNLNFEG
jgi:hypothetical protein